MNWPVVRLGEFATPVTRVRQNGDAPPVLSISKHEGFVRSSEYFKKVVHSQDLSKYKLVTPGDFAFSRFTLMKDLLGWRPRRDLSVQCIEFLKSTQRLALEIILSGY